MPKLWSETIESHRREVSDAILEATASLVSERGLRAVTMSQIAQRSAIGRATLYKYFPDVDAILSAWHERQVAAHLDHLQELRDRSVGASAALAAVLEGYALMTWTAARRHHGSDLSAMLHHDHSLASSRHRLRELITALIAEAAAGGDVRSDVSAEELGVFCINALSDVASIENEAAVKRLVAVTLSALRPL